MKLTSLTAVVPGYRLVTERSSSIGCWFGHQPACGSSLCSNQLLTSSESEAQRALHYPWRSCRGNLTEKRIHLLSGSQVIARCRIDPGILRVVERIICLPPQLEVPLFAFNRELLGDGEVRVVHARVP